MAELSHIERVFSALGNKRRLEILDLIKDGISNPGEIARRMMLPRSTIEKHLRVLLNAKIVEKVPSLTSKGQLRVYYRMHNKISKIIQNTKEILKDI
ncbi:MAG: ArsR/SmtB family transcription factor [Candidatus Thorarchaeota archaeon]